MQPGLLHGGGEEQPEAQGAQSEAQSFGSLPGYPDLRFEGDQLPGGATQGVRFFRFEVEQKPEVEAHGERLQVSMFDAQLSSPVPVLMPTCWC